jgi:putative spermidine/putrescine transport system permease protein
VGPQGARSVALAGSIEADVAAAGSSELRRRRPPLAWVGTLPFFAYTTAFLLLPSAAILVEAFKDDKGSWTSHNVHAILQHQFLNAYQTSIKLSFVTAGAGVVLGFLLAYAAANPGTPRAIRSALTTFSGVAANFGGIPLAFAFIATLGNVGILTRFLKDIGIDIYGQGFTLYSFTGVAIVYVYFQIPLMVLVIAPAIDGLRQEWREAATNLGASAVEYCRFVWVPILLPSLLGAFILLFGNSFAAYATAYALTSSSVNLVPIQIGAVVNGNVLSDPQLGYALALGMIIVIAVAMTIYAFAQQRAARWRR